MKYKLSRIASIAGGTLAGDDRTAELVLSDSRGTVDSPNALFVALYGVNHDGHDFLKNMYERGVRAFLVSRPVDEAAFPEAGFVRVNDTLAALQALAAYHRKHFKGRVAAITGSNGKTVTKEWIAQLCPDSVKIFRSPRSYNSQLGVPLSILMLEGDEAFAVIEAGISRPGEMALLEAIVAPDIGIITNIGPAHQENFSDLHEKLLEKLVLFRNCPTIIYNSDMEPVDEEMKHLFAERNLLTLGESGRGITVMRSGSGGVKLRLSAGGKTFETALPFTDEASLENAMQALALYLAMDFDPEQIIPGLARLQPVAMRLELREGVGRGKIVNDSYNSDINSLSVALDYLNSVAGGQEKVLILSDMLQTGLSAGELYEGVFHLIEKKGIDCLIGIGPNISANAALFDCPSEFYPTTEKFLHNLKKSFFEGKAVLVKGARPFQFEKISRALEHKVHTTMLEVDLDAMAHNLTVARSRLAPGVKVMAMVKALAYGSGSYEVAALLQHRRVDYLAVAFADEGVALREAGITLPIVVLNADSWSFQQMVEYRLEPEIYSFTSLEMFIGEAVRQGEQNYPVHVKFDTGMHRLGFLEGEVDELIDRVKREESVKIHSVFTHLAASDDPAEDEFTHDQLILFERMSDKIRKAFPSEKILRHAANSAAIERLPEARFDMVRLGIGLYGIGANPGGEPLRTVSTLRSRIVQIKHLGPGETVGYNRRGHIDRPTVIATVPIGYADGLDRRLGNGAWSFSVKGRMAPTIGNICMDTCMIDVTGIDVREGDEATVFGETPAATEMARVLGTIPYEIFTSVSSRVKRVFLKE
ncbi:MAG: bifunctional UDP-N-acetylmuramoyl-tripeptide:D-alanyl-D-alanine ligase/alanine racemase [Rikenellaceae bacterium]|jgi:alanine racemase|nr:bifunctional UDP-N-acetylmuramoyl-tripeptide:D-alanyl-D-alanine ligase/alanine racemase [Rikenellaceae bacterium]